MNATDNEIRTAQKLLRFAALRNGGEMTTELCREVVEFMASDEWEDRGGQWANSLMFALTGSLALCTY